MNWQEAAVKRRFKRDLHNDGHQMEILYAIPSLFDFQLHSWYEDRQVDFKASSNYC